MSTGRGPKTAHRYDRGPYARGRNIDLSKAAAKEIGIDKENGEAPVKIEADVP